MTWCVLPVIVNLASRLRRSRRISAFTRVRGSIDDHGQIVARDPKRSQWVRVPPLQRTDRIIVDPGANDPGAIDSHVLLAEGVQDPFCGVDSWELSTGLIVGDRRA